MWKQCEGELSSQLCLPLSLTFRRGFLRVLTCAKPTCEGHCNAPRLINAGCAVLRRRPYFTVDCGMCQFWIEGGVF